MEEHCAKLVIIFSKVVVYNKFMRYEVEIRKRAEKDLSAISKPDAQSVADAIYALENGLTGNIKKLTNHTPEYRLRVGDWRVLFEVSKDKIIIYRIRHRKEAYR